MRLLLCLLALVLFASPLEAEWRVSGRETLPSSAGLEFTHVALEAAGDNASLHVVLATGARHTLAVTDDPTGEFRVATAGASTGALATVNGGYFDPAHQPLGLVIEQGKTLHPLQRATLLSGFVLASPKRVSLLRLAEYKPNPLYAAALQAGPFLLDRGRPVPGLNATRSAARTIVFTADGGAFGIMLLRSATLAETAQILAVPQLLPGHPIARALNLDGGSSSGLWVRQAGGGFSSRELKNVRTYLSIVPR